MKFYNNLYVVVFIYLASSLDITTARSKSNYNNSGRGNCINRGGEFYKKNQKKTQFCHKYQTREVPFMLA